MFPKDDGEDGESTGFLCPFWFLEYSDDPKEVNVEMHSKLDHYSQGSKKFDEATIKIPVARNFMKDVTETLEPSKRRKGRGK